MKVEFHPAADEELAASIRHYNNCQPGLGIKLYNEVLERLDWIVAHPELPRLRPGHRRVNLTVFPYYIAYLSLEEIIFVAAVAHAHRQPNYWRERLKSI